MASINGISIKGIKKFLGHEGEILFQGNLYLNNKKIAYWSQDSHGGPDIFKFDKGWKQEKLLNDIIKTIYSEKPHMTEYDLEDLIIDFLDLINDEKLYKKSVKAGYKGVLIATDGYHETVWNLPSSYVALSDEALLKGLKDDINNAKKTFFPEDEFRKHTVKIYRSLEDFVVGEPIKLETINIDNLLLNASERAPHDTNSKNKTEKDNIEIN